MGIGQYFEMFCFWLNFVYHEYFDCLFTKLIQKEKIQKFILRMKKKKNKQTKQNKIKNKNKKQKP